MMLYARCMLGYDTGFKVANSTNSTQPSSTDGGKCIGDYCQVTIQSFRGNSTNSAIPKCGTPYVICGNSTALCNMPYTTTNNCPRNDNNITIIGTYDPL
jgi:hypothetical protein